MPLQWYYSTVKEQSQQMHTPNGQLGLQISCKNHEKSGQASQFGGRYQTLEIALQMSSTDVDKHGNVRTWFYYNSYKKIVVEKLLCRMIFHILQNLIMRNGQKSQPIWEQIEEH